MRLDVASSSKGDEIFQRWLSDPSTRDFIIYLRTHEITRNSTELASKSCNKSIGQQPQYFPPLAGSSLPNSVAGVSASIIHQPSVITSTASSSAKLSPTDKSSIENGQSSGESQSEKRNRAAVLNEIEKALQGLPAAITSATTATKSTTTTTNGNGTTIAKSQETSSKKTSIESPAKKSTTVTAVVKRSVDSSKSVDQSSKSASKSASSAADESAIKKSVDQSPSIKDNNRQVSSDQSSPNSPAVVQQPPTKNGDARQHQPLASIRALLTRRPTDRPVESVDAIINKSAAIFRSLPGGKAESTVDFGRVCRAFGLPGCLKKALFAACSNGKKFLVQYDLTKFWTNLGEEGGDESVVVVKLLSTDSARSYVTMDDLNLLVQTVVDDHPGLAFLREAPEFHSRYVQTVIARIFYGVNRSWSGRLTASEIRRSNLLDVLHRLDEEEDINRITQYFSYEHFYVIYCKFWELDRDHDLLIDKEDLARFDDYALSRRAIDRVFSSALNNDRQSLTDGRMTYPQFVRFILAEKDKRHPTSVEYWFRCMDLDGDGIISIFELQHFYDEQSEKMILCGIEPMPFVDILCLVMDMVRPRIPNKIALADLKQCKMAPVFFDTFMNLHRYLEHEQMESGGGMNAAMRGGVADNTETTHNEWNAYAAEEYEALVAEEADMGTEIKCDESDEEER